MVGAAGSAVVVVVVAPASVSVDAVVTKPKRRGPEHGGKIERRVEMRERRPAARALPFQGRPQTRRIDGDKHEPVFSGENLGQSAFELMRGGKVNKAVAEIVDGAREMSLAFSLAEGGRGQNLIDGIRHFSGAGQ